MPENSHFVKKYKRGCNLNSQFKGTESMQYRCNPTSVRDV